MKDVAVNHACSLELHCSGHRPSGKRSALPEFLHHRIEATSGWLWLRHRWPKAHLAYYRCAISYRQRATNFMTQNPKDPARRKLFRTAAIASGLAVAARVTPLQPLLASVRQPSLASHGAADVPSFEFDEITIAELQAGMTAGKYNARAVAEKYLARIDQIDKNGPAINAVIQINPDALAIAEALDKERADKGVRGPLHGIPVMIKDNLDTADNMMTTAGSLALVGSKPSKDSTVAEKLRQAGVVILAKTNLSEWANIRSGHSTSGWSGRGGQTKNPYALDRNPCGSSSGSGAGVSANLCVGAIGTETDGSIVCPSSSNGLVGIKPTVGLTSRIGIIPISHSQDGAGPMCRTVRDAATMLGAITGIDEEIAPLPRAGKSRTPTTRSF